MLNIAYKHTFESKHDIPLAAIITNGSRVVSCGINQRRSHPQQREMFNPLRYIHAEIAAIIGSSVDQRHGGTLYVVRRSKVGNLALAKPCETCMEAIRDARIKRVVFSISGHPGNRDCEWDNTGNFCEYGIIEL